ncbi:MTOR-associated protein MEAK7-like [Argonauta hians]
MGAGNTKADDSVSAKYFDESERERISELFLRISKGNETFTREQYKEYIKNKLNDDVAQNFYEHILCSHSRCPSRGYANNHAATVSHLKFSDSLASLLKGSVEEKGKAVIALCKRKTTTKPPATIPRPEYIEFEALHQLVEQLSECLWMLMSRIMTQHYNWSLTCYSDSIKRLVTALLQDLPLTNKNYNSNGFELSETEVEIWLLKASLFRQIFDTVFFKCFNLMTDLYLQDGSISSVMEHQLIHVPQVTGVNWNRFSTILDFPSLVYLCHYLPKEFCTKWSLLFSSRVHGNSFTQLSSSILNKGPTVLIVRDKDKHCFGGITSCSWQLQPKFYGSHDCRLFSLTPELAVYQPTGYNDHFMYMNQGQQTIPNGIGMGGQLHYFGLWIDEAFDTGHSKAIPKCTTYGSPQLSAQAEFHVDTIEVWSIQSVIPETSQGGASILDGNADTKALLDMIGKERHSEGFRQPDNEM